MQRLFILNSWHILHFALKTLLAAVNLKCDHTNSVQQKIASTYYESNIQNATEINIFYY